MSSRFNKVNEYREETSIFYGIDRRERIPGGYFADLKNMSSSRYPCLASRSQRANVVYDETVTAPGEPTAAIVYKNGLMLACSNGMIMYGNKVIDGLTVTRALVPFGNKVFCAPSGILIDKNFSSYKFARLYYYQAFSVTPCDSSFNDIDESAYSEEAPTEPTNGQLWYDTENTGLYKYSKSQTEWAAVPDVYIRIKASSFDDFINFNEGDAVSLVFEGKADADVDNLAMNTFVASVGDDYIIVEGNLPDVGYIGEYQVMIERKLPTLDYAVCHNNRVWGCFYNGIINEIYASKLGDPLNWYCYRGISTDSYAVSCGEHGSFTGCTELGDAVVFFKENCIYTVYGSEPSNFQTVKTDCFGVQEGSEKSICKINGSVYYKSCHGIMKLSEGSLPVCVSDELGADVWRDATAGTDGRNYYVVMTDSKGQREMFVYDTKYSFWHKEDIGCSNLFCFTEFGNNLLCVGKKLTEYPAKEIRIPKLTEDMAPEKDDFDSVGLYILAIIGFALAMQIYYLYIRGKTDEEIKQYIAQREEKDISEVTQEEFDELIDMVYERIPTYKHDLTFSYITNEATCNAYLPVFNDEGYKIADEGRFYWKAETGIRGLSLSVYKRLKGLFIRMKLSPGARCDVFIEYDGRGKWESIGSFEDDGINTFRICDRLDKCDTYRLRFIGYGNIVIYSIVENYEEAGTVGF